MEQKIKNLIECHYKNAKVDNIILVRDYLTLEMFTTFAKYPYIAKKILDKFPEIGVVHFTGGWIESVCTRETLRYAGYKMKEHKSKKVC